MEKGEKINSIHQDLLFFQGSSLYNFRLENNYLPVIGEGSYDAKVVFVGEAPGKKEAETGRPFCGRSGKLLDEMLLSIGLSREEVYITNLVNDRPQDNRDPTPAEIALYSPFLDRQLAIIQPQLIVLLGRLSMKYLFEKAGLKDKLTTIGEMHGKVFVGELPYGKVMLLPLYHPAYGIYNAKKRPELFADFAVIKKIINKQS